MAARSWLTSRRNAVRVSTSPQVSAEIHEATRLVSVSCFSAESRKSSNRLSAFFKGLADGIL
eukprot:scaffold235080_cov31-Attheya_sp.AAC.1